MKMPRSEDRGTIAGRATIAGRHGAFSSEVDTGSREENASNKSKASIQVADGAAGWNTSAKPSMQ
jgi:hypothetical protein